MTWNSSRSLSILLALLGLALPASTTVSAAGSFDDALVTGESFELEIVDGKLNDTAGRALQYVIRGTMWTPPEGSEYPVIVYNHGLQSHQGWFFRTAEDLAAAGYPVIAFDRIGSGISDPGASRRGGDLLRSRGHIRSWELFVATLDRVVQFAAESFPNREIAVWGNSYGAKVVTAYLLAHADELADRGVTRAIYTVPGLFPNEKTMPLQFSKLRLIFSGNGHLFPVPMVEVDGDNGAGWFIGQGDSFERIRGDAVSLRQATRKFWLETRALDRFIAGTTRGQRLPVPVLLLMVDGDRLMDNDRMLEFISRTAAPESVEKFFDGGPGAKHFLLFTEDRSEALEDIGKFLQGRGEEIAGAL